MAYTDKSFFEKIKPMVIKDMQETIRSLVLESTGLQPLLEQLAKKRLEQAEEDNFTAATQQTPLTELVEAMPDDGDIATEEDNVATEHDFAEDEEDLGEDEETAPVIKRKEN